MSLSNTLRAYFETIDLAELAARQLKDQFPGIKSIVIQYKNFPPVSHENDGKELADTLNRDFALNPGIVNQGTGFTSFNNNITPIPSMSLNNRILAGHDTAYQNAYPESEQTTESCLMIKTSAADADAVGHRLRSMGGQRISKH